MLGKKYAKNFRTCGELLRREKTSMTTSLKTLEINSLPIHSEWCGRKKRKNDFLERKHNVFATHTAKGIRNASSRRDTCRGRRIYSENI